MNRRDIRLLQKIKGSPAVTITLPAQRTTLEEQELPIRVNSLVKQTADRLLSECEKSEAEPVMAQLEKLVESIDYSYTQNGLAMFVNRDFGRAVHLPFSLQERVGVDKSFYTRDLIYAMNRTARYWTLVLSEKPTRLYEGTREILVEIKEGVFPLTHTGPGVEKPVTGGFGTRRTAIRDERHRQFFRQVDTAIKPFMTEDPLPLAVLGLEHFLTFFVEVSGHRESILATLTGSYENTSPQELSGLVWPLVKAGLADQRLRVLAGLNQAISEGKFAATVRDVWRLAKEGRGRLLLVEEDFHYPVRLDETGERLVAANDPTFPGVMEDAVDEIIEIVLSKHGQVVFVDNGRLESHQRIALVLRD